MYGVILLYLRNSTTHDPATCLSNKLTYLIYDGVEKLIEEQAKTLIEGSSAAKYDEARLEGNRKEENRTENSQTPLL